MAQITLPSELTNCSIWELVVYWDYQDRNAGIFRDEECSKIENEINSRGILARTFASRFNFYKPLKKHPTLDK